VWSNYGDPNTSNNTARSTIHVVPLPSPPTPSAGGQPVSYLRLQHQGPRGQVLVGQRHTFTIVLTNHGPDPARDVVITFTSSLPLQIISAHAAHASAVHDACTTKVPIRCEVGTVPNGGRVTLTILGVARAAGLLRTAAAAMSASWDPNPLTSIASAKTRILTVAQPPPRVTG
jgi:uncharacterized repeat protein (TIGR01451 family)